MLLIETKNLALALILKVLKLYNDWFSIIIIVWWL